MSDPSELDALIQKTHRQQGPCYTKVLRVNMCRSIISLNKITKCGMTKKSYGDGGWRQDGGGGGQNLKNGG